MRRIRYCRYAQNCLAKKAFLINDLRREGWVEQLRGQCRRSRQNTVHSHSTRMRYRTRAPASRFGAIAV